MRLVYILTLLFFFEAESIVPSFHLDPTMNLDVTSQFIHQLFFESSEQINVCSFNGKEICTLQADVSTHKLARLNHKRAFISALKDMPGTQEEQCWEAITQELVSLIKSDGGYSIEIKGYATRHPLIINIAVTIEESNERTYPAFGKTEEESLNIAAAIVQAALKGETEGKVEVHQKRDSLDELFCFDGLLEFRLTYRAQKKIQLEKDFNSLLELKKKNIILTIKAEGYECYFLSNPKDKQSFNLEFLNSPNHQAWQKIIQSLQQNINGKTSIKEQTLARFYFETVFVKRFISNSQYMVCILYPPKYYGETQWAVDFSSVCSSLCWNSFIITQDDKNYEKVLLLKYLNVYLNNVLKPNFSVALEFSLQCVNTSKSMNFVAITLSIDRMLFLRRLDDINTRLNKYDGYLYANEDRESLKQIIKAEDQSKPVLTVFPSTKITYAPVTQFNRIFYCGVNWDRLRGSEKYKSLFKLLQKENLIDVYGPPEGWTFLDKAYKGQLPFEPLAIESVSNNYGISLCLHSQEHIDSAMPTLRFFESIAAGVVIICDKHPFFEKHYKDASFFIDTSADSFEIYNNIVEIYRWVINNPDQTIKKIKLSQQIFNSKHSVLFSVQQVALAYENNRKRNQ